jgi:hypothetical protein
MIGKSNILDAICFLLGITNLSQVRATNLQEKKIPSAASPHHSVYFLASLFY